MQHFTKMFFKVLFFSICKFEFEHLNINIFKKSPHIVTVFYKCLYKEFIAIKYDKNYDLSLIYPQLFI